MAGTSKFALSSTATAIALILPAQKSTNVQAIRQIHDKAFHKWPPHINLIYPSVTTEQLKEALPLLRSAVASHSTTLAIEADRIGTFEHRKNATIFLQPSQNSEALIGSLRSQLVQALGLGDGAGTRDGTFRPHLTLGQVMLMKSGDAIKRLMDKVEPLTGLSWENTALAVLRRKPSGEMEIIDEIKLGSTSSETSSQFNVHASDTSVWSPCFSYETSNGWQSLDYSNAANPAIEHEKISIVSWNLLADTFGCAFEPRMPIIIDALKNVSMHTNQVLCFQEVSQGMLTSLLNDPFMQQGFPFASHSHHSVLRNHLNLVTFATAPFSFAIQHFADRHKSALVVRPVHTIVEIANVHLTAALKDENIAAKQRQITALTAFFANSTGATKRCPIIAGDFNLATSGRTISQALERKDITFSTAVAARSLIDPDVWDDAYLLTSSDVDLEGHDEGEDGATFDVQANPWAAESNAPPDQRPQRYDRILFKKSHRLKVISYQRFGFPNAGGECGSDHFGIAAVLDLASSRSLPPTVSKGSSIDAIEDTQDIYELLAPFIPNDVDRQRRRDSISRLTHILSSDIRLPEVKIVPLGSYAMGTFFVDSDVDFLIIGTLSPSAFFSIASQRLKCLGDGLKGLHYINYLVPVIEMEAMGIKFDVQYCQAPDILSAMNRTGATINDVVFDRNVIDGLQPPALRPLNTYRDTAYLLRTIPEIEVFRSAHRLLSLYLRRRGLYSAKFGYLGGVHLSLMLNHLIKCLDVSEQFNAASLVRTFFVYYASFDWTEDIVCDPEYPHHDYQRSTREPLVILAVHSPTARPNVASSCTKLSAQLFAHQFGLAAHQLEAGNWSWLLRPPDEVLNDLVTSYRAFITITLDVWNLPRFGVSSAREVFGAIESKIPSLMVQLDQTTELRGQAWPFRLKSIHDEVEEGQQAKGHYLIGLSIPMLQHAADRRLVQGKLVQAAQDFERMVKDARGYSGEFCLVQAEVMSRKKVVDMGFTFAS